MSDEIKPRMVDGEACKHEFECAYECTDCQAEHYECTKCGVPQQIAMMDDLRSALAESQDHHREAKAEIEELTAALTEARGEIEGDEGYQEQCRALRTRLEQAERERDEAREELRLSEEAPDRDVEFCKMCEQTHAERLDAAESRADRLAATVEAIHKWCDEKLNIEMRTELRALLADKGEG